MYSHHKNVLHKSENLGHTVLCDRPNSYSNNITRCMVFQTKDTQGMCIYTVMTCTGSQYHNEPITRLVITNLK